MAEEFIPDVVTLTDENGNELDFVFLKRAEFEGKEYFALTPATKHPDFQDDEYTILRLEMIEGTEDSTLVPIDDDDEWERVADFFEDLLFDETDYDEK